MRVVDFHSDTRTLPTREMRRAMAEAEVGDDVSREDPTVNRLEEMAAERLGKEAALFVSSGTQGNLVSILTHCQRGDEIIVGESTHIFRGEAGGASALGGIAYHTLRNDERGMLDPDEVAAAVKPANVHYPHTALVALENTHNSCGGVPLTAEYTEVIADVAHAHDLVLHIDGARIFNASVYLETPVSELVKDADSVSFCLSKGLGCPVGSVICGTNEFIDRARFWRKMVGGGMRQVGIIAAAGIVALESMVTRLAEDHSNARRLADGLSRIPGISIDPDSLPTNLVFFDITAGDPGELARRLEERGIKGGGPQRRWRFVTRHGIVGDDIAYALDVMESTFKEYAAA
ncbi:MAG: low-specificity L-threonine aldolase [Chloroflexi bacterium]|nr:low-specificity L-threonine aldolase [Chloroflexota bacterium]